MREVTGSILLTDGCLPGVPANQVSEPPGWGSEAGECAKVKATL